MQLTVAGSLYYSNANFGYYDDYCMFTYSTHASDYFLSPHASSSPGAHKSFHHASRHDYEKGEYLTMLVPSDALDWGSSSLAVRAALNATTAAPGDPAGQAGEGAWVEIGCQIISARLVQDVTFSG